MAKWNENTVSQVIKKRRETRNFVSINFLILNINIKKINQIHHKVS